MRACLRAGLSAVLCARRGACAGGFVRLSMAARDGGVKQQQVPHNRPTFRVKVRNGVG
jgi:hypothetical protein